MMALEEYTEAARAMLGQFGAGDAVVTGQHLAAAKACVEAYLASRHVDEKAALAAAQGDELPLRALELASHLQRDLDDPGAIVKRAEVYLAFLRGETAPASGEEKTT